MSFLGHKGGGNEVSIFFLIGVLPLKQNKKTDKGELISDKKFITDEVYTMKFTLTNYF